MLKRSSGPEIPVLADDHTALWVLKKSPGDTWEIQDEAGKPVTLRLVGLVQGSIFQSELLIHEEHFRKIFPSQAGFRYFLIETDKTHIMPIKTLFDSTLGERYGWGTTTTADRLADFYAVENTYISTFQALGAMGLLLGTLGLTVVLTRNIWERRGELALLRALGYTPQGLGWMVLVENGMLVTMGLSIGLTSAALAVLPSLFGQVSQLSFPLTALMQLIGLVILFGLGAGGLAVLSVWRTPLLPALRRE
jgi:ABC-type antimicrobial peptide transport system permease subunit